ncbi:MAG: glycoside hydrolase family 9 protein [Candidatus Geothermincolia bacterium]
MANVRIPARSARAITILMALALLLLPLAAAVPSHADPLKEAGMVAPAPAEPRANILSASWMELELPELEYNAANVTNTSLYTVSSADDPGFTAGIHPDLVNYRYWADSAPYNPGLTPEDDDGGKGTDVAHINIVYRIFLRLPTPMSEGKTYSVSVDPSVVTAGPFAVTYEALAPRDAIHVNQVAYLSDGPKVAYLSLWTGQGCIDFGSAATFQVIDESDGQPAFSGGVHFDVAAADESWSKSDVYSMDFTSFTSEGSYHLYVPGVGSSYPFEISERAYNDIGYTIVRGIGMQRDGDHGLDNTAVTHWSRPDAHLDDAFDEATIPGPAKDLYTESDLAAATRVDLTGGHMDAGDRGKYPHNSADVASSLLSAITLFPGQVEGLGESLQLRESSNGVPDLIDETVIELDWLRKAVMNTSTQGGLPFTLRPNGFGYEGYMPAEGATDRVFYNKSHGPNRSETLFASGALAMACNTPLLQKYLPADKLATYMAAALKAFECFENNKDDDAFWATEEEACWYDPKLPLQTWSDVWEDEMMFAAANLHRATGQSRYLDWVNATKPAEYRDWRVWYWSHYGPPLYGYLSLFEDTYADPALRQWARDGIMNGAETTEVYDWKDYEKPFGAPLPWHAQSTVGWYFTGSEMGFPQMLGYGVSGETKYLDQLARNWNYLLGTNPLGRSFVSGLGNPQRRPRWFVHELSQRKWAEYKNGMGGWSEPPPGIPSPDLQDGYHEWYMDDAWNTPRKDKRFPAIEDYAPLYRYHDSWTTTDEMTIDRMTRNACSLVPLVSAGQPAASSITLVSPNGGERWARGSNHQIAWTSSGLVGNVKIEYSTDGFKTARLVSAATANDGSFTWKVPDEPTSTCKVRVRALDGDPADSSDSFFTITGPASASAFFFAEGTARPGFEPYLCVQNPGATAADVKITYMKGDGTTSVQTISVGATSRSTVVVKDFLGSADDAAHDFSAKVECTNGQGIIAERPMYFNYGGVWSGGHDVVGAQ